MANPATMFLLKCLVDRARQCEALTLDGDIPGLFDSNFLLREQLIGERRGLLTFERLLKDQLQEITTEIKEQNEKRPEPDDGLGS